VEMQRMRTFDIRAFPFIFVSGLRTNRHVKTLVETDAVLRHDEVLPRLPRPHKTLQAIRVHSTPGGQMRSVQFPRAASARVDLLSRLYGPL
jgi:hypothetical protein